MRNYFFEKKRTNVFLNILILLLIIFLLVLPDICFYFIGVLKTFATSFKSWLFILPIAVSLLLSKNNKFTAGILIFFGLLQIMQFVHMTYFGTTLSSFALYLFVAQFSDVFSEASEVWYRYIYVIAFVVIPFFLIYFFNKKLYKYRYKTAFSYFVFSVFMIIISYKTLTPDRERKYMPNPLRLTINNSLRVVLGYLDILLCNKRPVIDKYKPYHIVDKGEVTKPKTIVYIIGESMNYNHMSLFGFKEKTTPKLEELSKDKTFYYTKGISSSIATLSACKFIMNTIYEPDNMRQGSIYETNLFKLAKMHGFKTFYISHQSDNIFSSVGTNEDIDVIIVRNSERSNFIKYSDEYLVSLINKQEYSDKNFIIIHQWCVHSPYTCYSKDYKNPKKFFRPDQDQRISDYNDFMYYNDGIIADIFNFFNKWKGNYYIIWASDHNELFGENGVWGHGKLLPECADIPVMVQSNDTEFLNKFKEIFRPTHYEIGKMIMEQLGYILENPNEEKDIFYIDGVDATGICGYIKFQKDLKNKKINILTKSNAYEGN